MRVPRFLFQAEGASGLHAARMVAAAAAYSAGVCQPGAVWGVGARCSGAASSRSVRRSPVWKRAGHARPGPHPAHPQRPRSHRPQPLDAPPPGSPRDRPRASSSSAHTARAGGSRRSAAGSVIPPTTAKARPVGEPVRTLAPGHVPLQANQPARSRPSASPPCNRMRDGPYTILPKLRPNAENNGRDGGA